MKRVAVVYGGWSSERDVSVVSGTKMLEAAIAAGYDAVGVDLQKASFVDQIKDAAPEVILNGLHGPGARMAACKVCLNCSRYHTPNSGVRASAMAMDKIVSEIDLFATWS